MGEKTFSCEQTLQCSAGQFFQKVAFNPNLRQFFSLDFRQKD